MMTRFQKAGGAAALAATLCFLFAFALAATALAPMTTPELDFGEYLGLYHERGSLIYLWHFAMYIVLGLCLTILVLALHERLKEGSPALRGSPRPSGSSGRPSSFGAA
ncbi:MAG: hypothetical protein Q8M76_08365 [Spirochaetaceae bacterium]|nr:hypothetical protein [Spirochaetaceae bacterium]